MQLQRGVEYSIVRGTEVDLTTLLYCRPLSRAVPCHTHRPAGIVSTLSGSRAQWQPWLLQSTSTRGAAPLRWKPPKSKAQALYPASRSFSLNSTRLARIPETTSGVILHQRAQRRSRSIGISVFCTSTYSIGPSSSTLPLPFSFDALSDPLSIDAARPSQG